MTDKCHFNIKRQIFKTNMVEGTTENVKVFIRIRPQNENELEEESSNFIKLDRNFITLNKSGVEKTFKFYKIFDDKSSQIDVYRTIAAPVVEKAFSGYNGTIFAYGQSGTGKTYTMIGDINETDRKGIVPNIFSHIFAQISVANSDVSCVVTVTYLEIYNEEIRDLLSQNPSTKLTVHERPGVGVYVKDLLGFTVNSLESVVDILKKGNRNRATGSTNLNDVSSRSHAIFTIKLEVKKKNENRTVYGKINLVDLAGSERVAKTLATGDRLKEALKINLSLSVLGNVISALIDEKATYIPYRNSKLTRLLQDSLGGNSVTSMIALLSPNNDDCDENMYTLMYADRVKHIQNHVTVNVEKKGLIETFENKIAQLKQELEMLLYQEKREKKRKLHKCKSSSSQEEYDKIEVEKMNLETKINLMQKKILIGGESLVEKAQTQLALLEDTAKELIHLDSAHELLKEVLHSREKEKYTVEKQFSDLQEEDKELDLKIAETEKLIAKSIEVVEKKENEYQNEIGSLLYTNKVLAREMSLVHFVVESTIPSNQLEIIKNNILYDEETQEWQIKGIAYCGNNMKKDSFTKNKGIESCKQIYKKYRSKKKKQHNQEHDAECN